MLNPCKQKRLLLMIFLGSLQALRLHLLNRLHPLRPVYAQNVTKNLHREKNS
jgi:hypothetical protein